MNAIKDSRVKVSVSFQLSPAPRECGQRSEVGFTRTDLAAALAAFALLFLLVWPLLAQSQSRSQLAICFGNLRQVGRAMLSWNAEHGARDPWRVGPEFGGTARHLSGLENNLWFQFAWFSNELRTPRILACPADATVKVASDFGFATTNSFLDASIRNNAVSYFLGLDALAESPQSVLSGDRNLRVQAMTTSCSSGINPAWQIDPNNTGWNQTNLHGATGYLLFHDGRVELRSSAGLRQAFDPSVGTDVGVLHVLIGRF
jgi:hypothetical protein